jgi:hypothetical protein
MGILMEVGETIREFSMISMILGDYESTNK